MSGSPYSSAAATNGFASHTSQISYDSFENKPVTNLSLLQSLPLLTLRDDMCNTAGQCVNINAMADTPALGSQETRERLRRAYHYVSKAVVFQLKRFQNYTVRSSSFSELNRASFGLRRISVDGNSRHIQFLRLFDGTKVQEQLYSTRLVEFFQTHDAALQKELKTKLDSKEKTLGKILGKFLFKPLVGEYRLARQEEDSKTCYLGMGHPSSWHGWPDMVAGETPPGNTPIVLATTDKAEEESTESEPESESEEDSRDVEQSQEGQVVESVED